jgi:hypothetical protein
MRPSLQNAMDHKELLNYFSKRKSHEKGSLHGGPGPRGGSWVHEALDHSGPLISISVVEI